MATYIVGLRLEGDSGEEIISRISAWKLNEDEGVVSVTAQPEMVVVPDELRVDPAPRIQQQQRPPAQSIAPPQ